MSRTIRVLASSVRAMTRHRMRTFFMMLGTFVGIAALIVILAMGRGTQQVVLDRMDRMLGGSTILLRSGTAQFRGGAHSGGPATTLTIADIRAVDSAMTSVEYADPWIMTGPREVIYDGRSASIRLSGHSEAAELAWNRSVSSGAFFTADDVASAARVALVGTVVREELFEGRNPVGEQIRIAGVPFQVIGVLEQAGVDPHGIDLDNQIQIPVTTMMRRVLNIDNVIGAKFLLSTGTDLEMAVLEIGDVLRARHQLGPDQPNDFTMFTPMQVQTAIKSANRTFTVFLPLIAAISILIGGLVVANLMLMSVNERRAEIGLRKATGARPRDIRLQFIAEAASVTALGGILAVAAGYAILQVIAMHGEPARMPWSAAALGVGVAIVVGILSGVVPARRAASLDPVLTLR